mmetsp:Transcript_10839/g.22932  ORF Transcript_10839/g.22932 Transcript_10839/m.22932 type:complete len:229 (-) Transcript_10839:169-855(-)
MSEIIVGINTPTFSSMRMGGVSNPVCHQIIHVGIGTFKIHLQSQSQSSLGMQTQPHLFKEFQVPLYRSITTSPRQNVLTRNGKLLIWILPNRTSRAPLLGQITLRFHLRLGHIADVGQAPLDQLHGQLVKLLEIVRGVRGLLGFPTQPLQIPPKRIDILRSLGVGVGVVITEDGSTTLHGNAELIEGEAEVHVHGLGVADVEVAVGFGGEAGAHNALVDGGVFGEELG